MRQGGAEAGLAAKPSNVRLRALSVEALDSNVAAQDAVLSQEHSRHPSRAEAPVDAEAVGQHDPWPNLGRYRHTRSITRTSLPKTGIDCSPRGQAQCFRSEAGPRETAYRAEG
jgi:hypothetical protein